MADMTEHYATVAINLLRGTAATPPAAIYLALYTNAGVEVVGGGYVRKPITLTGPVAGTIEEGDPPVAVPAMIVENTADIEFPIATADWGNVTRGVVFDALTGGTMWLNGLMKTSKIIESGDQFRIPAGQLQFALKKNA